MTRAVCVAAIVGLGVWFAAEHQTRLRLSEAHKSLEQQFDEMAILIARNEELSNLLARTKQTQSLPDDQSREVLRLRGEVGVLRQQSKDLEAVRNENRQARAVSEDGLKTQGAGSAGAAGTADYWPRNSWVFTGYDSPDAALQTSLWAANNGDLRALLASATGEVRQMMEKDFEGKSSNEAAIRAMDEVASLKSVRVLNREVQADDTVVLTAEFEERAETHTQKLLMKRIGNGWKLSGPAD